MNMGTTQDRKISAVAIKKHLNGLGIKKGDSVCLRAFYPSKSEHSDNGRKCEFTFPTLPAQELAQWSREGRGIYAVVNPGGHKDSDVTECRAIFYEHDQLSKEVSLSLWESLKLPRPTIQVDTGGKSIHSYWLFDKPCTVEEWRSLQTDLLEYADADRSLKNPSRVMRLAGCIHPGTGQQSTIVSEGGNRYSYKALRDAIPRGEADAPLFQQSQEKRQSWTEFDRNFRLPISEAIPLDICISRNNRDLLAHGAQDHRNDNGITLACDLIGTEAHLIAVGQRVDRQPYDLFIQYCQRCPSDDWSQQEWDQIWKSAQSKRPGPSLAPDRIETCVKHWQWRQQQVMSHAIVKDLPKAKTVELSEAPEGATDEEKLRTAIANYNKVCDAGNLFQSIPLKNKISREWGLSPKQIDRLARYEARESGVKLVPIADVALDVFQEIEERSQSGKAFGTPVGFRDLDAITQGFQPANLIITAARPSVGKTSFVVNQCRNVAIDQGKPVVIFSLEMSKEELVYRLLSGEAEINNVNLKNGSVSEEEYIKLAHAIDRLTDCEIYFDDISDIHVEEIRGKLRTFVSETKKTPGMVMIDYLQIMGGIEGDVVNDVARITRNLKAIARDFKCPIHALSQLNRRVENQTNKRPTSADLRSSGAIEQDADLIMMLYRDEMHNKDTLDKGIAEVIITKHRNGPLGTIKLAFDGRFTKFKDLIV